MDGTRGPARTIDQGSGARTVDQGGRAKAYRPIPREERRRALASALAAWERGDWFEHDPCTTETLAPTFFGRSLVEKIRACPTPQEIGSHSFSHVIFGDPVHEVRKRLDGAVQCYNQAAGSFESRVLVTARRMKDLKVTTAEELPAAESIDTVPRVLRQMGLMGLPDGATVPEPGEIEPI